MIIVHVVIFLHNNLVIDIKVLIGVNFSSWTIDMCVYTHNTTYEIYLLRHKIKKIYLAHTKSKK